MLNGCGVSVLQEEKILEIDLHSESVSQDRSSEPCAGPTRPVPV